MASRTADSKACQKYAASASMPWFEAHDISIASWDGCRQGQGTPGEVDASLFTYLNKYFQQLLANLPA